MNLYDRDNLNSSDALIQLVKEIKAPLASIIEANKKLTTTTNDERGESNTNDVIFNSSQEIASLIDDVVKLANGGKAIERAPLIYQIYYGNKRVRSMCRKEIDPNKISQKDTSWLMEMENEVYKNIKHKDLNLYDLSYRMAVSERQLHRKIKNLLHLTPNKYIRILRLHKAKQFIDDYVYDTISQISYAVGYYDTHYFSKLFNQQYGTFPKELLKERRL